MEDRKACPFCGKDKGFLDIEQWTVYGNQNHEEYAVACMNCGAQGPNEISREQAVKSWNMRRTQSLYESPAVTYEAKLEVRAGTPLGLPDPLTLGE